MTVVCLLLQLYVIALFGRVILSWFPIGPGSALAPVFSALYTVTEPVLGPFRRLIPPVRAGGMAIDLSVIIALILVQMISREIC